MLFASTSPKFYPPKFRNWPNFSPRMTSACLYPQVHDFLIRCSLLWIFFSHFKSSLSDGLSGDIATLTGLCLGLILTPKGIGQVRFPIKIAATVNVVKQCGWIWSNGYWILVVCTFPKLFSHTHLLHSTQQDPLHLYLEVHSFYYSIVSTKRYQRRRRRTLGPGRGPGMNEVSFRARPHHNVYSTLGVDPKGITI
jgi:hypothetical protein